MMVPTLLLQGILVICMDSIKSELPPGRLWWDSDGDICLGITAIPVDPTQVGGRRIEWLGRDGPDCANFENKLNKASRHLNHGEPDQALEELGGLSFFGADSYEYQSRLGTAYLDSAELRRTGGQLDALMLEPSQAEQGPSYRLKSDLAQRYQGAISAFRTFDNLLSYSAYRNELIQKSSPETLQIRLKEANQKALFSAKQMQSLIDSVAIVASAGDSARSLQSVPFSAPEHSSTHVETLLCATAEARQNISSAHPNKEQFWRQWAETEKSRLLDALGTEAEDPALISERDRKFLGGQKRERNHLESVLQTASRHLNRGQPDRALEVLSKIPALGVDSYAYQSRLGMAYLESAEVRRVGEPLEPVVLVPNQVEQGPSYRLKSDLADRYRGALFAFKAFDTLLGQSDHRAEFISKNGPEMLQTCLQDAAQRALFSAEQIQSLIDSVAIVASAGDAARWMNQVPFLEPKYISTNIDTWLISTAEARQEVLSAHRDPEQFWRQWAEQEKSRLLNSTGDETAPVLDQALGQP